MSELKKKVSKDHVRITSVRYFLHCILGDIEKLSPEAREKFEIILKDCGIEKIENFETLERELQILKDILFCEQRENSVSNTNPIQE